MANEVQIGGGGALFVGEDKTLRLECLDVASLPVDMATWTLLFDVRLKDNSSEPAILSVVPTLTGVYNVVRAVNTQRAVVTISDDQLNLFVAKSYRHSWKRMDSGMETVLAYGYFAPQKATAP